ncbi:MAG: topoisomerase DNA-binding C4 zinc finger domain-containing protein [Solirubrobacterales bacterium]
MTSLTLATIIQIETLRFCRRFLTPEARQAREKFYDPKGRQYDQMTQAARSGRQNIIEGSERAATSKGAEMKLTDVARASLSERLTAKRVEAREKDKPSVPECPLCSKPMRRRNSTQGPFWGCSAFPSCRGSRPIRGKPRSGRD